MLGIYIEQFVHAFLYSPIVSSLLIVVSLWFMVKIWFWKTELQSKIVLEEWLKLNTKATTVLEKKVNELKMDLKKIFNKHPEHWFFNKKAIQRIEEMIFMEEIQNFHNAVKEELWQIEYH